ncbi:YncE family protein, partial [Sulfitobacter sp. HI0129]
MPSNKVHQSCRFAALAALAVAAQTATVQAQQVSVTNPSVEAGTLSVDVTGLNGSGFVVVHAVAEGGGPVVPQSIGNAYVPEGVEHVTVPIGAPVAAGDKLFVMLHTDSGVARVYEFGEGTTDIDTPVMVDGKPVVIPIAVDTVTARQAPALPGAQAIAAGDRVYTADQSSNTVTVISPAEEKVLGTITLGAQRIEKNMAPVDQHEENVHGLGFARDGSAVSVVSVSSNAVQVLDPATNKVQTTAYVGRSPHEAFVSPDGKTVWAAIRGEGYVSVIDRETGEVQDRITTASGPSKVV